MHEIAADDPDAEPRAPRAHEVQRFPHARADDPGQQRLAQRMAGLELRGHARWAPRVGLR